MAFSSKNLTHNEAPIRYDVLIDHEQLATATGMFLVLEKEPTDLRVLAPLRQVMMPLIIWVSPEKTFVRWDERADLPTQHNWKRHEKRNPKTLPA